MHIYAILYIIPHIRMHGKEKDHIRHDYTRHDMVLSIIYAYTSKLLPSIAYPVIALPALYPV